MDHGVGYDEHEGDERQESETFGDVGKEAHGSVLELSKLSFEFIDEVAHARSVGMTVEIFPRLGDLLA